MEIPESLWQYYKDDPNDNIVNSKSFKFTINVTEKMHAAGNTKDVKIVAQWRYLGNSFKIKE